MLFHIRAGLFFSSPNGEIAYQFLIAPLVVQIDLFYEITFNVLIDFFCLLALNRDRSIDLPHRSGPTKCRGGTDVAITGIQCGAEEAEMLFLPSPLLCGTQTSNLPSF